jgi:hypothetical protein
LKPRSTFRRAVARDSQAWFVIGILSGGVAVSAWLSIAESFRVTPRMPPLLGVAGCFFLTVLRRGIGVPQLTLPLVVLATGVLPRIGVRDLTTAALSALLPAVALLCSLRIHRALANRRQPWSLGVRALLAAVPIALDSAGFSVLVLPRMRGLEA